MIKRIDTPSGRFYAGISDLGLTEWCYPSVTAKIDAVYPKDSYLINFIREQGLGGQAIFEKSGDEGTEVHIAIETIINGGEVPTEGMSTKVKRCIQSFIDWAIEFKPVFVDTEEIVVNHELHVAGTRDCRAMLNYKEYKGIYVIDWKTSNSVHDSHRIQVSGYWSCGAPTDKTALLHLGNKTKQGWSFLEFDPVPFFEKFKHFNRTFELLYPNIQPKIEEFPENFKLPTSLIIPQCKK